MSNESKKLIARTGGIFSIAVALYGYVTGDISLLYIFIFVGLVLGVVSIYYDNKADKDADSIAIETLSRLNRKK